MIVSNGNMFTSHAVDVHAWYVQCTCCLCVSFDLLFVSIYCYDSRVFYFSAVSLGGGSNQIRLYQLGRWGGGENPGRLYIKSDSNSINDRMEHWKIWCIMWDKRSKHTLHIPIECVDGTKAAYSVFQNACEYFWLIFFSIVKENGKHLIAQKVE